ncbi:HtaA domain-containing protein [Leifsonia naganoensis]|uniref:Htaa domain-containing protein n=1 Tax=Leifsonia naganoensis TaxID=150025 RepID=A0A853DU26_9MICO|nr:HtaA domain-containing protein [Leifsonia naganoensis]NYK09185.1 hypothetical protein [Leifsonia naganoensis]
MYDSDLVWGIRASFLAYVEVVGAIEVILPASRAAAGALRFPLAEVADNEFRYSGKVAFRAHHGALSLTIGDPWIRVRGNHDATMSLLHLTASHPDGKRVVVAKVAPDGATELVEAGAALFDYQYPVGAELDPVRFASRRLSTSHGIG